MGFLRAERGKTTIVRELSEGRLGSHVHTRDNTSLTQGRTSLVVGGDHALRAERAEEEMGRDRAEEEAKEGG